MPQSDGTPVFDITDFDETLPAPFEWDLKRLATSFVVTRVAAAWPERACRHLARTAVAAYRRHMALLMRLDPVQCLAIADRCDRGAGRHRRRQSCASAN